MLLGKKKGGANRVDDIQALLGQGLRGLAVARASRHGVQNLNEQDKKRKKNKERKKRIRYMSDPVGK